MEMRDPSVEEYRQAVYQHADELLQSGLPGKQVERELVQNGLHPDLAYTVVRDLVLARSKAAKDAGRNNMLVGALVFVLGVVVTAVTYSMAQGGGTYTIAWGAVAFGLFQFLRGVVQFREG